MSEHRSFPKPTPKIRERMAEQRAELARWFHCCRAVEARDRYICRVCLRHVRRTLTLCADRMEHHHLVPRSLAPHLVASPSNVLTCCAECHGKLTRHELTAQGLDANQPVSFI